MKAGESPRRNRLIRKNVARATLLSGGAGGALYCAA
jgi:hypothetical protein